MRAAESSASIHKYRVHRVSSSRDGSIVAAAGQDGIVRLWDPQGKKLAEFGDIWNVIIRGEEVVFQADRYLFYYNEGSIEIFEPVAISRKSSVVLESAAGALERCHFLFAKPSSSIAPAFAIWFGRPFATDRPKDEK